MTWGIVASAGASLVGGAISSNASKKAAKTQADAASQAADAQLTATRESNALQKEMFEGQQGFAREQWERARSDIEPFRAGGLAANNRLLQLLGIDVPTASVMGTLGGGNGQTADQVRNRLRSQFTRTAPDGSATWENTVGLDDAVSAEMLRLAAPDVGPAGMSGAPAGMAPRPGDFGSLNQRFGAKQFEEDPGYQHRMQEGIKAVQRGVAGKGGIGSGRYLKDLTAFGQGLGTQEYGAARDRWNQDQGTTYNRLAGVSGNGQTATGALTSAGQNYTNAMTQAYGAYGQNVGQNLMAAGNARGSAYTDGAAARAAGSVGSGNAWNQAIGQGVNAYQQNALMRALRPPSSSGWQNPGGWAGTSLANHFYGFGTGGD